MTQLLNFSRNRRTEVEQLDETTLKSTCRIQDNLTDALVEIVAKLPDLEITQARAQIKRSPRMECLNADGPMEKAIGIRIGAGMTEIIKGALSENIDCEELIFMVEECCHGIIISLTREIMEKAPFDPEGEHAFYTNMVTKNIRLYNRCAAFAPGSTLVEGLTPPE